MSEVRFTDYYSEEIIPPAPAGFQRPAAGAVVSLPEKLKAMKAEFKAVTDELARRSAN